MDGYGYNPLARYGAGAGGVCGGGGEGGGGEAGGRGGGANGNKKVLIYSRKRCCYNYGLRERESDSKVHHHHHNRTPREDPVLPRTVSLEKER